jgi:hypothetical protein
MKRIKMKRWRLFRLGFYVLALLANSFHGAYQANAQEGNSAQRRMWVIYFMAENVNPKPGTLGALYPIHEMYYDASTVRSVGQKRFVESTSCAYRRWKPGEPMTYGQVSRGELSCKLENESSNVIGIDCKNNTYLFSGRISPSPEWKTIQPESPVAKLKKELC